MTRLIGENSGKALHAYCLVCGIIQILLKLNVVAYEVSLLNADFFANAGKWCARRFIDKAPRQRRANGKKHRKST